MAALIFCTLAATVFISTSSKFFENFEALQIFYLSLACGAIGAVSELVSFFGLDDNLTQPLVSSALLSLLFWQVGGVVYV
jgi:dolichol kinase